MRRGKGTPSVTPEGGEGNRLQHGLCAAAWWLQLSAGTFLREELWQCLGSNRSGIDRALLNSIGLKRVATTAFTAETCGI